jgi:phosphatidylserine/phosphatidylglycerophosphate/cardiolipin synthase-like enzyme
MNEPKAPILILCFLFGIALPAPTMADDAVPPDEGGFVESMGQPPRFMPYAGLGVGAYRPADDGTDVTGTLTLGLFRNLLSPVASIGLAGEGYVGARGASIDGGIRGLVSLRPLRFGVGIDYNIPDNDPDLLLSFLHPLRRGGPFGLGGRLRIDYLPTRDHSFQVGFVIPLFQKWMGRTRPETDHVAIFVPRQGAVRPPAPDPVLLEALAHVRDAADWINRFTTPFFDPAGGSREESVQRFVARVEHFKQHIAERSALYPDGRGFPAEIRVYHRELDRAFSFAASGGAAGRSIGESTPLGREVSAQAREILLAEVVLPYNRMLGRIKKPDSTLGYAARARDAFDLWLNREPRIPAGARPALRHVLQGVLDAIEENREGSARYWETSELVWIPIHLALRPDQLDTQVEIDRLLERGVGETFSGGNEHYYVINEQFQWELLQHIREAQDYHVLWIHDFRGVGNDKQADEIGFELVFKGYLETLIRRVRAYDTTGKLPTYLIFLDQNFYEPNRGRIWMSFLEDPLHAKVSLPGGDDAREKEAAIAKAQQELRAAVAESALLQQRARAYGDDWLRNRIKVHVSITNPVDWSFWSQRVLPVLGLPDVVMRDHRKISFYDVTETDPGKGEAIFTGMGVGDHYAGPTWEDRAILASGPSLVGLKRAAREMLLQQGFGEDEIPHPLRPLPKPNDYGEQVARLEAEGHRFRAMQIHNQTGYGPKPINVAKATLYNAMPGGSILVVPDSLWNSPFWAGMLTGNALRGGRVFVISPALENAPSAGFPQMSRAQEIFAQMILIQRMLGDELAAVDGSLHTGVYAVDLDVGDLAGRTALYYDNLLTSPLVPAFFGITAEENPARWSEYVALNRRAKAQVLGRLAELGFEPGYAVEDVALRKPKLHLKAQIFLNGAALNLFKQVGLMKIVEETMVQRARQVQGEEYVDIREAWKTSSRLWEEAGRKVRAKARPEDMEKATGYLTVGSHNMDYRGMMMDGEVLYVTASGGLIPGLRDLFVIAGISSWIDDLEELEKLIPAYSEWQRRVGRYIKYAL